MNSSSSLWNLLITIFFLFLIQTLVVYVPSLLTLILWILKNLIFNKVKEV